MKKLVFVVFSVCFLIGSAAVCSAQAPDCTADRHLDECGQNCLYTTTTVDPPTTTTTTLDSAGGCPAGCIDVTDIPQCPDVICGGADTTSVVNVTVNRCPSVVFPKYAPCKARKNGKARTGDVVFQGRAYKCPRFYAPQRFFIPLP